MKALTTAATGMLAQQLNVEVISNNLANLNTTAFKRQRPEFQDLLYQNIERVGANTSAQGTVAPSGLQVGVGVRAASTVRMMEQGGMDRTENTLDIAINGPGFFRIQLPDGQEAYTRGGSFQLDQNGGLVTADGFIVQPNIVIPQEARDITINQEGEVQIILDGQVQPQIVGQLDLATFANDAGLEAQGGNLFLETQASGPPNVAVPGTNGFGTVRQGYLERSNVNPVIEITNMITAQRAYELNSRVIRAADEMLNAVNSIS
ncbi:flagellar basal-body rod protein FlgG [Rhodothalassium salexigens]|uniref:Flagellar basal-body rod protein FlgG n=1 Tax=Rhodothalassium salexigens DSM 2132 TaxID=1188247 RepID=A0A4R2PWE4_RHOSA|nr:flagellar basal-body rod protein FlgG [Rhodothalassium salexigens]MBB4210411.1 flagellar basal-body rod protein FlgG [Rhodothalassium salexigens DSM 2132]MBK1640058.1 flagellar basal-body rod protein FlgG [Rhodothalassium salexigens DSM 2132]MBK5910918.1 flagellar basal-body rod protein FlgG [Rhodothalassium salexigens]MBK5919502.1 flagellar basal-body rod protein FlgG [Rhodothalassium salexigens]TCP38575.1 flagellar basal-body rod protein FlgG [Rhodothalassium salexigens DSM 2132]